MAILESSPVLMRDYQKSLYTDSTLPGWIFTMRSVNNFNDQNLNNFRDGTKNPNWKHQVALKIDATTNYRRRRTTISNPIYACASLIRTFYQGSEYMRSSTTSEGIGMAFYTINDMIQSGDDDTLRDRALVRVKRKLEENINSFSSIVPLVELREMRGLIRNTAQLATSAVRGLIDIKRTRGASAYQWAADAWLNFSFGVKPLIADTKNLDNAISAYLTRQDIDVREMGSANKTWVTSGRKLNRTGSYLTPIEEAFEARHKLSYRYIAAHQMNLRSSNNYGVLDHFGFDVSALPSVAWELTPFSWVVDYFTTVGAYLEDTFELPEGQTKYLLLNKRYTMEAVTKCNHYLLPDNSERISLMSFNMSQPGYISHSDLVRTKLASLPRRNLRFKTVDEIGKGAVNKLLNLSSILASGGRRPRA